DPEAPREGPRTSARERGGGARRDRAAVPDLPRAGARSRTHANRRLRAHRDRRDPDADPVAERSGGPIERWVQRWHPRRGGAPPRLAGGARGGRDARARSRVATAAHAGAAGLRPRGGPLPSPIGDRIEREVVSTGRERGSDARGRAPRGALPRDRSP